MKLEPKNCLVGFDRDGTIDSPGHPIPQGLVKQCSDLATLGLQFFIASGKSMEFLDRYLMEIPLDAAIVCAENGGYIRLPSGYETIISPNADLLEFTELVKGLNLPNHGPEPKRSIWSRKFGPSALIASDLIKDFITKHDWDLDVLCHPDVDGGLDVVPPSIHKGLLAEHLPDGKVIHFFGDSYNDIRGCKSSSVNCSFFAKPTSLAGAAALGSGRGRATWVWVGVSQ